jgi:surface antigen
MKNSNVFKKIAATAVLSSTLVLAGCNSATMPASNAQLGALGGAVVGGMVGNQFGEGDGKMLMTILGTVIGGYLGGMFGQQWDNNDRRYIAESVAYNKPVSWNTRNTSYTSYPGQTFTGYVNGRATTCKYVNIQGNSYGQYDQVQTKVCLIPGTNQWQFQ